MKRPESHLNRKQQNYRRYVVEKLVADTWVDVRDQKIWHPYDSYYSRSLIGGAPLGFIEFVKDEFGILYEEVELLWIHYKNVLQDQNGWIQINLIHESLNYSEKEKNFYKKQDMFIEYVVNELIGDTHIETVVFRGNRIASGEKIDAPFFRINRVLPQSFLGIVGMSWEARNLFNDYIKNKYGAVIEGEMNQIFTFYVERLKELVMEVNPESFTFTDNLDESIEIHPKQQQLFNYVLKEMLNGTEIRPPIPGRLLLIVPEFIKPASPFLYPHYLKSPAFPTPKHNMLYYFKNNYGLVAHEVITLWNRYREIMYRELRKEFPNSFRDDEPVEEIFKKGINEGMKYKGSDEFKRIDNPKQHKFFNKIADKVVELTVVRDESWGKNIFLTDLLDPTYPGQGMSLPPPVNMPDYDTFNKRMGTVIHDFFPMLEKYWYIDDIFANIFILTKFVFPKLWNNFYKGEDQPEESTDYGERALDYEEEMGKEHKSDNNLTFKEEINESTDKQDKFKDFVINNLVDLTRVDVENKRINYPFPTVGDIDLYVPYMGDQNNKVLAFPSLTYSLAKRLREIYGLLDKELPKIWALYHYKLNDKVKSMGGTITESTSKKQKFLDTVLKDMINLSTIYRSQFDVDTVITPSGNEVFNFHLLVKMLTPPHYLTSYMRDTYGLIDEEINHVWLRYKDIILDRIKKRGGENSPFRD